MIVKPCIFSPSLTRQLHYHSQLDKSVAWFWKSNEDNLLWILWMRSQFTWKWPPTLIEVVCFTYFAALLYRAAYSAAGLCARLRNYLPTSNWQNFKQANQDLKLRDRCQDEARVTLQISVDLGATGESELMGQPEPDSPDVQSLPNESDFMRCQRAFHLLLSHLSHNCAFPCCLWILNLKDDQ